MELITELVEVDALPSATVLLLRDGKEGLEVFLIKRHGQNDVLGGAYVFPGGKTDAGDAALAARADVAPALLHAALGEPELAPATAAALHVTAIREAFEETGVLFADVRPDVARAAWAALHAGTPSDTLLATTGTGLLASRLQPWSRWVTPYRPSFQRKRFDTRFFLAEVPPGQHPVHDSHEAVASLWLTPRAALRQYWDNDIELAPPQLMSLVQLARHRDVASVFAAARTCPPPCIRPHPMDVNGVRIVCYPGDPSHPSRERVMQGPLRLYYRNRHFEPAEGLSALLGE